MTDTKYHCATCATIERCKKTFGKYWPDKSRGGIGCNRPIVNTSLAEIVTGNLPPPPKASFRQGRLI